MIKVIFFDVGGVLMRSDYDFDEVYRAFGRAIGMDAERCAELHRNYLNDMLTGKFSARRFFALAKKESGFKGDMERVWVRVASKGALLDKMLLRLTDRLRKRYSIAMLSNITEMRGYIDKELDLASHFDRLFLSYKLKTKKPYPKMYRSAIKAMKLKPGESVFIDDQEKNLIPARKAGMIGIRYKNIKKLRVDLINAGVDL